MCRNLRGWHGQRWYRRQASQTQSSDILFCRFVARILGRTAHTLTTRAFFELYDKEYDQVDQTTRGLAYEKAMERLMQKYPEDQEAAIFYALALNETALHSDKSYANQLKAGAILEKVAETQPEHPGVVHYVI